MSEIRVNTFKAEDGISAPSFPNGIQVTGVVTATVLDTTVPFLNERHLTNLSACLSNLNDTDEIIENKLPFDLLSIELRDGIQNLSKITGQELTEELLDNIFSKFCIGK